MASTRSRAPSVYDYRNEGFTGWSRSAAASSILGFAAIGMALTLLTYVILDVLSANRLIYSSLPRSANESWFVSDPINISGGGNIAVEVDSNVDNAYLDLELRLIDDTRKVAYVVYTDVEYYHGYEDGYWSEGDGRGVVYFSRIPAGTYVLEAFPLSNGTDVTYSLRVFRDRTRTSYLWWMLGWFGGWILLILLARNPKVE